MRQHNVLNSIFHDITFKDNCLPVVISGRNLTALIDTGAAFSCLPAQFLKQLPFHYIRKFYHEVNKCCYTASGQEIPILGCITLPVILNDTRYNVKFRVLPQLIS